MHDVWEPGTGIPGRIWSEKRPLWGRGLLQFQVFDSLFEVLGLQTWSLPFLEHLSRLRLQVPLQNRYTIRFLASSRTRFGSSLQPGRPYQIEVGETAQALEFRGCCLAGRVEIDTRQVVMLVAAAPRQEMLAMEIENGLRLAAGVLAGLEGTLLVHSAVVRWGADTWVFSGPHNAGKSTLAGLAPAGAVVLGDDLNALAWRAGSLWAAALPFRSAGEQSRNPSRVSSILRIRQARCFLVRPLTPARSLAALIASTPYLNRSPRLIGRIWPVLERIAGRVPCGELRFPKNPGVYSWLKREPGCMSRSVSPALRVKAS